MFAVLLVAICGISPVAAQFGQGMGAGRGAARGGTGVAGSDGGEDTGPQLGKLGQQTGVPTGRFTDTGPQLGKLPGGGLGAQAPGGAGGSGGGARRSPAEGPPPLGSGSARDGETTNEPLGDDMSTFFKRRGTTQGGPGVAAATGGAGARGTGFQPSKLAPDEADSQQSKLEATGRTSREQPGGRSGGFRASSLAPDEADANGEGRAASGAHHRGHRGTVAGDTDSERQHNGRGATSGRRSKGGQPASDSKRSDPEALQSSVPQDRAFGDVGRGGTRKTKSAQGTESRSAGNAADANGEAGESWWSKLMGGGGTKKGKEKERDVRRRREGAPEVDPEDIPARGGSDFFDQLETRAPSSRTRRESSGGGGGSSSSSSSSSSSRGVADNAASGARNSGHARGSSRDGAGASAGADGNDRTGATSRNDAAAGQAGRGDKGSGGEGAAWGAPRGGQLSAAEIEAMYKKNAWSRPAPDQDGQDDEEALSPLTPPSAATLSNAPVSDLSSPIPTSNSKATGPTATSAHTKVGTGMAEDQSSYVGSGMQAGATGKDRVTQGWERPGGQAQKWPEEAKQQLANARQDIGRPGLQEPQSDGARSATGTPASPIASAAGSSERLGAPGPSAGHPRRERAQGRGSAPPPAPPPAPAPAPGAGMPRAPRPPPMAAGETAGAPEARWLGGRRAGPGVPPGVMDSASSRRSHVPPGGMPHGQHAPPGGRGPGYARGPMRPRPPPMGPGRGSRVRPQQGGLAEALTELAAAVGETATVMAGAVTGVVWGLVGGVRASKELIVRPASQELR